MRASDLQVGDWIKPTVCMMGHPIGPARVTEITTFYDNVTSKMRCFIRLLELFEPEQSNTHDIDEDTEVELCD